MKKKNVKVKKNLNNFYLIQIPLNQLQKLKGGFIIDDADGL